MTILENLANESVLFGDIPLVIGEMNQNTVHYLLDMGAKQAGGDVAAQRASFVGRKDDGSEPAIVWSAKRRNAVATKLGVSTYDDADMAGREALADMHFAAQLTAKLERIVSGELRATSRKRRTGDEAEMFAIAVEWFAVAAEKQRKKPLAMAKELAEKNVIEADDDDKALLTAAYEWYLERGREKIAAQLAARKAARLSGIEI